MNEEGSFNPIQDVVEVLKKKPDQRTANDLKRLISATSDIPFFDKYTEQGKENVVSQCCKHMKYEGMEKGGIVFQIDDVGTKFYLILSGKVGVYIKDPQSTLKDQSPQLPLNQKHGSQNNQENEEGVDNSKDHDKILEKKQGTSPEKGSPLKLGGTHSHKLTSTSLKESNNQNTNSTEQKNFNPETYYVQLRQRFNRIQKKQDGNFESTRKNGESDGFDRWELFSPKNKHNMICVKQIDAGNSFGELALINNKPRLASIICLEDCQFAILEKEDFSQILKQIEEKLLDKEISFLANLHIFQGWNKNLLKQLYLNSYRANFNRGQIIFREGDTCENVYIVNQGEFIGYKVFEFERDQGISDKPEQAAIEQGNTLEQINQVHGSQRQTELIQIKMSILTPHEMFGEEDLLLKQNRTYSVKCSSMIGQLIVIKNKNFNMRILQDDYTKQYLMDRLDQKQKAFQERAKKVMQQYKQYKRYLLSSTDNMFDVCIDAIKKQSSEQTDYHQPSSQSQQISQDNSISPAKNRTSNNRQEVLPQQSKQVKNDETLEKQNLYQNEENKIHMLQKVLNYDLKYHRQSLQKGLSGVHSKEFKEMSIRKNQKEVNIEMQHYAQMFNQYQPDKFINMNLQEEMNNHESKTSQKQNLQENTQTEQKKKRSNSVAALKNETRDQLLNQYRQIIYQQSSIHFKIKCHQAQKSKSDRSQIDYLKVMREKGKSGQTLEQQATEKILKRARIMSANNAMSTERTISPEKKANIQGQHIFGIEGRAFACKTELSPEKGQQMRYYSARPRSQKVSLVDELEEEKEDNSLFHQSQNGQYNFYEKEKKQVKNFMTEQTHDNSVVEYSHQTDNNILNYLKLQSQQKSISVKQNSYITNYFQGDEDRKSLSRVQSYGQIYRHTSNASSSNASTFLNVIPKKSTDNLKRRSVSLQNNSSQSQYNSNQNKQIPIAVKGELPLQSSSQQASKNSIQKKKKKEDPLSFDRFCVKKAYLSLQDQLRKPKWKYEKFDIIGNVKLMGTEKEKQNLEHKGKLSKQTTDQKQQIWQAYIISKTAQKQ